MGEPTPLRIEQGNTTEGAAELGGSDSGGGSGVEARIERLEQAVNGLQNEISGLRGDISGIKHAQNVTIGAVGAVGAILFAAMVVIYTSVSDTNTRIDALPDRLTAIANSLFNAASASRSQQPIIVNVPPLLPSPESVIPDKSVPGTAPSESQQ